jgi:thiamine pyrophosphokinase
MPAEEPMNDTVVIVTGASPLDPRAVASVPFGSIVIAADGGLDHAREAGLHPAGLIGDLDSISPEGLAWATEHATIQRHPAGKDLTDTELAVAFAADMHPGRLLLLAGAGPGDRLDHQLAAIGALGAPVLTSVPVVEAFWGSQYLRVLHGPGRATLDVDVGQIVSLLALHGTCTGVVVSGTEWELERVELAPLVGLGVSNVARSARVDLAVSTGVLTVFVGTAEVVP